MAVLETWLILALQRTQILVPLIAVAFFLGDYIARFTGLNWALAKFDRTAVTLAHRLDRPARSIATRVYRGMIAVGILLLPMLVIGVLLSTPTNAASLLRLLVIVAILGHGFANAHLIRHLRHAKALILPLELPGKAYIFADTHAVLRYLILENAEAFAIFVIGSSFWFVAGGMPALFAYIGLALLARRFTTPAFGWAAASLFRLFDFLPRLLTSILLNLAALFVSGARPFAALTARRFTTRLARLLDVSLGGQMPLPFGDVPWVGTGTPKLLPQHLLRFLLLKVAATTLLILLLAEPYIAKLLTNII